MLTGLNRILDAARDRPDDIINTALETVRRHFRMDVAYLSEIVGDRTVFRAVSAPGFEAMIKPGDSMPLEAVYCQRIINGDFPNMIPDTDLEPGLQDYAITRSLPIGSHVSLPVRRDDGRVYGMFCCLARTPRPDLNLRDLEVMQLFSDVASTQVNKSLRQRSERQDKEDRIAAVIQSSGFVMHYQPILRLADMQLAGLESLCRFSADPPRSPDLWFGEAAELGLGVELELAAIAAALAALPTLPPDCYLSVNAGPATVADGRLGAVLTGRGGHRLVV
jgi:GAF domain-containing protein